MKNLHRIQPDIPDKVKLIAIGWARNGYSNIYPLFYNPDTDQLMYTFGNEARRLFKEHNEDTLYSRTGRSVGISTFTYDLVVITDKTPTHNY